MKFKGWGTSLAWWANINYPDNIKHDIIELLFAKSGLSLNIARYNLGGGINPLDTETSLGIEKLMPCIKAGPNEKFNLENDKLQLSILHEAVKRGVNYVEIFSNSPPWWMTNSGKTNGADSISTNNLRTDKIKDYAEFLVDSYNLLSEKYPITSLEPFNEPSNPFWTSSNGQEGCYFDFNIRNKVIRHIKQINSNITLTAADSFSVGFALPWYIFSEKHLVDQINIHGYGLNWKGYSLHLDNLNALRKFFRSITSKPIWMSEFGMGGPDNIENALKLAKQIYRDLETLKPEAWVYWQVIENSSSEGWGLIHIPFNNPNEIIIRKQYWIMMHFTKTLTEGDYYNFINSNIIEIKNDINKKLSYIILGKTDLSKYQQLHLQTIKITDKDNNYKTLVKLPNENQESSIISFSVKIQN